MRLSVIFPKHMSKVRERIHMSRSRRGSSTLLSIYSHTAVACEKTYVNSVVGGLRAPICDTPRHRIAQPSNHAAQSHLHARGEALIRSLQTR